MSKCKIRVQIYDITRDAHFWSEFYDVDSLEFAQIKNWKDIKSIFVVEEMTQEEFKLFMEKYNEQPSQV